MVKSSLCLLIALGFIACSEQSSQNIAIAEYPEEVKWVSAKADIVSVLTKEPPECLTRVTSFALREQFDLGRLAFRSPYLLGGQATRRGLSCHSCHTNGDVNRGFFIQGLSGEPGTADVTSFHFSKSLGDEAFNPKPIPSLTDLDPVANDNEASEREAFILRLVEEEFDGNPPTESIKLALIAYVDALDANYCPSNIWENEALFDHQLAVIDSGLALLQSPTVRESADIAFIVSALRNELGRLNKRFPEAVQIEQQLKEMSRLLKSADPANFEKAYSLWIDLNSTWKKTTISLSIIASS